MTLTRKELLIICNLKVLHSSCVPTKLVFSFYIPKKACMLMEKSVKSKLLVTLKLNAQLDDYTLFNQC